MAPLEGELGVGKLAVTPFAHPWMCLLRYDVGDLARLASGRCACGRDQGATLDDILGRVEDVSFARDGRAVTAAALDEAVAEVAGAAPIISYQVDHDRPGDVRLLALAAGPLDEAGIAGDPSSRFGQAKTPARR